MNSLPAPTARGNTVSCTGSPTQKTMAPSPTPPRFSTRRESISTAPPPLAALTTWASFTRSRHSELTAACLGLLSMEINPLPSKKLDPHLNRYLALAVILMLATSADAGSKFKVLRSFHCDPSGCGPTGGLAFDAGGNLYGTTSGGGNADATVFRLSPLSGGGWTYSLLYTLTIKQGSELVAGLTLDPTGNLYGTADYGGAHDVGSVFELSTDPAVAGGWTLQVLHSFLNSHQDGSGPWDKVILDKAGNLYGTTREGGANGGGIAFKLKPGTGGEWTEAILHNFPATPHDGGLSYAELVQDKSGNLYGTTSSGGTGNGDGTVFKLTHTAPGWKETLLHSFQGPDGSTPITGLVFDAKGNLYGTTQEGGGHNSGTVFKLAPTATGRWKHTVLYDFPKFQNGG